MADAETNTGHANEQPPSQQAGATVDEHGVDAELRRAAEAEMRRVLPDAERDAKRPKTLHVGRFAYGAGSTLSQGAAGFVLTCHMGREHSSMKEAGGLLMNSIRKQLGLPEEPAAAATAAQAEAEAEAESDGEGAAEEGSAGPGRPQEEEGAAHDQTAPGEPALQSVKLGCRGVVALRLVLPESLQEGAASQLQLSPDSIVLEAARSIIEAVESGRVRRMRHLQRIVPMMTSAALDMPELEAAAARLAGRVADEVLAAGSSGGSGSTPGANAAAADAAAPAAAGDKGKEQSSEEEGISITFAVAYYGRGSEGGPGQEAQAKKALSGGKLPERMAAIKAVADGFSGALKQHGITAKVNLTTPDWVLLCDVLPTAGRPHVSLAALPASLCAFQAKINIKSIGQGMPTGPSKKKQHPRKAGRK